ncbi:MAG TPA: DsbA family oxidoreductase [Tahibacter sp.]|nr:DsbA family oxidoreductase [Tahibacter sp.]
MSAQPTTPAAMQIDFISDITCPWCAIGLAHLERAIARLDGEIRITLRQQPFELNPDIGPGGEDILQYAARTYDAAPPEVVARQALIRSRAAEAGLRFPARTRVYNTHDAHRLLLWAERAGRELPLKRTLLEAYHAHGANLAARDVLLQAVQDAGLDTIAARDVLDSEAYAATLRQRVQHWRARGVNAVPTILIDDRTVLRGGQSAAALEVALRQLALQVAA